MECYYNFGANWQTIAHVEELPQLHFVGTNKDHMIEQSAKNVNKLEV